MKPTRAPRCLPDTSIPRGGRGADRWLAFRRRVLQVEMLGQARWRMLTGGEAVVEGPEGGTGEVWERKRE